MEDNEGRSIADSDIAPSNLSFRSAATVTSIPLQGATYEIVVTNTWLQGISRTISSYFPLFAVVPKPPSLLAQSIVQDLGVEGASAVAAMQVKSLFDSRYHRIQPILVDSSFL